MKNIIKDHEDLVLGISGVILAALLLATMAWSIKNLSQGLSSAASGKVNVSPKSTFDLEKAKSLDFKGLGN